MAKTFARILELDKECKISDMSWSELTEWREAVAQFFDAAVNQKYLGLLEEIEITYSGEKLLNHAFLMAGWLYSQLKRTPHHFSSTDDATIYFRRQSERLAIKIRKKKMDGRMGLYKIKLFAEQNEQSIIFTATATQNGDIETTVQKGGALSLPNYITVRSKNKVEMLCGELDFLQQDGIYLKACASIHEYLNEN
jgi:glucose-6-phosphate dehydrogenase assembly protein OpcA